VKDILVRLDDNLVQVVMRLAENKNVLKKYPEFKNDLKQLENSHKLKAIQDIMASYKIQHTLQIVRYFIDHERFDPELYETLMGKITRLQNKEILF
jgi:recombinational DNA repair protein (RecF pathway)